MIVQLFVRVQLTSLLLIAPEHNIASARIYTVLLIALCASREPKACQTAGCDNQGLQSLNAADTFIKRRHQVEVLLYVHKKSRFVRDVSK